jgi:tocopherol cyclase
LIFRSIRRIWRPAMYQGKMSMKGYFEGWYYKFADKTEKQVFALIPGVSFAKDGQQSHSFIQFIGDSGRSSRYFRFNIKDFSTSDNSSGIRIGKSYFSPARIEVDINQPPDSIKGSLSFKGLTPWPVKLLSPGAMGWYAFVPAMECYHGVLSFDHLIEGGLEFNGQYIDFSGGRGYIEKDWGSSFPSYHIWLQTNHFTTPGTSLMVSVANVPWLKNSFDGFIAGFYHDGRLYPFTTYSGARIVYLHYDQKKLKLHFQSKQYRLEISVSCQRGAELLTPVQGAMQGRLSESLAASTHLKFFRLDQGREDLVFEDEGRHTGLEIEGALPVAWSEELIIQPEFEINLPQAVPE